MIEALQFMFLAWRTYRSAKVRNRPQYGALTSHGVPEICIFVGLGREAWRISVRACEEFK